MKAIFYFLIIGLSLAATLSLNAQSCLPGRTEFSEQQQVDSFYIKYPGCEVIEGALIISFLVNDLSGLSTLKEIRGGLLIDISWELVDLSGLEQLTYLGDLRIYETHKLQSIEALSNVKTIDGGISIFRSGLQNFKGLENVDSLFGSIRVLESDLMNFEGLNNLKYIEGVLDIRESYNFINFQGLENLNRTGGLWISDSPSLINFAGLENVTFIGNTLHISHNYSLESLAGLSSFSAVHNLSIYDNPQLLSIQALDRSIDISGQLVLANNPLLELCNVESICTYMSDPPQDNYIIGNNKDCDTAEELVLDCRTNSIYSGNQSTINVYPNPAGEFLILDIPQECRTEWIRLYNLQGKTFDIDLNQNRIELSDLSPGMYFGQVMVDEKLHHFSFVKN